MKPPAIGCAHAPDGAKDLRRSFGQGLAQVNAAKADIEVF
jgi:hypothetical protein